MPRIDHEHPDTVVVWTDGSCYPNPDGPGGWAFYCTYRGKSTIRFGHSPSSTNNAMELTAILHALLYVPAGPEHDSPLVLFTDSQYCKNAITVWMDGWRSTGWKTAVGAPVKNVDLFEKLDAVMQAHQCWREVEIRWVRGHSGVPENELVDQKANHGRTTGLTNWKPKDNKHYPHVT